MASRRNFIKKGSITAIGLPWLSRSFENSGLRDPNGNIDWNEVRSHFPITSWEKIQMNSGSAGVMTNETRAHLVDLIHEMNSSAPYYAWGKWSEIKESNTERLAKHIGANSSDISVVRNTTEALNMIIYGMRFEKGDRIVAAKHDYPHALSAVKNRAKKDGLDLVLVDMTLPASEDRILKTYEEVLNENAKLLLVTHMTHREGFIMPVKKLADMAHRNGALVALDAAHSYGQFMHDIQDLGVDFYGTSLHKWLNAPHGNGLLYSKPESLDALDIYPSASESADKTIKQFEYLGTRSFAHEIGISSALDFYEELGPQVKQKRLYELKTYWTEKASDIKGFEIHSDPSYEKSCAVATFSIKGLSNGLIRRSLDQDFGIHAKSVGGSFGGGIRISPNIFTSYSELDKLVEAIRNIARSNQK